MWLKEVLGQFQQAVEVHVGDFGLNHPELSQVAARLGFLRAKGWAEAVDLAQGQRRGLNVELAGLGEIGGVAEVVHREKRRGAFAGRGSQDGRIGADKAVGVEIFRRCAHDLGADAQDGRLARRADPQMAVLHEEVDAMLLERDGIGIGLGHALDDLDVFNIELKAARGALVGADLAGDDDRRLLREAFEGLEDCRRHALDVRDALHGSRAVAKDGKQQLAALAEVVEPSAQRDGLAFVLAESGDGGNRSGWSCRAVLFRHGFLRFPCAGLDMLTGLSRIARLTEPRYVSAIAEGWLAAVFIARTAGRAWIRLAWENWNPAAASLAG